MLLTELWAACHLRGLKETEAECLELISISGDALHVELNPHQMVVRDMVLADNIELAKLAAKKLSETDPVAQYLLYLAHLKTNSISAELEQKLGCSDIFVRFILAKYYLQQGLKVKAEELLLHIVEEEFNFYEAWIMLFKSITCLETIEAISSALVNNGTLMSLKLLALLHSKYGIDLTRQAVKAAISTFTATFNTCDSNYFKRILFIFHCSENKFNEVQTDAEIFSIEFPTLYSDLLYVHAKKEELKIFAKKCTDVLGWSSSTCYVLGNLYSLLRNHSLAQTWFQRATVINPHLENALLLRGNELIELKQPAQAINCYNAVLKLDELNHRALFSLGNLYYLLDDLDKSIYYLKKASMIESNHYRIFDLLADCYSLLGLPEHAIQQLTIAAAKPKANANIWKKLALIYKTLDKKQNYISSFAEYFTKSLQKSCNNTLEISDDNEYEAASLIIKNSSNMDAEHVKALASALFKYPSKTPCQLPSADFPNVF